MKAKILILAAFAVIAALPAAAALTTAPSGLTSQLLTRGAAVDELKLAVPTQVTVTQLKKVRVKGKLRVRRVRVTKTIDRALVSCASATPCDAAMVRATLEPGGFTGWHAHPLPSLVIVRAGSLTMRESKGGQCITRTFSAGQSFIHPASTHNFVNSGPTQLEFFVAYFAPPGAALLIDAPAPAECP